MPVNSFFLLLVFAPRMMSSFSSPMRLVLFVCCAVIILRLIQNSNILHYIATFYFEFENLLETEAFTISVNIYSFIKILFKAIYI